MKCKNCGHIVRSIAAGVAIALLSASVASADYIAVGPIKGEACTSYLIVESCDMHSVDAVEGSDGQLYTLQTRYESVSDHKVLKDGTERCLIRLKARGLGLWSKAADLLLSNRFYTKTSSGEYESVDVEMLAFKCRKRD